jgi:uncharacterized protein
MAAKNFINCSRYDNLGKTFNKNNMTEKNIGKIAEIAKALLLLVAAIFLACMSYFIILQMGSGSWFRNIKAEVTEQPYARTVTVTADGKVTAKPDIAYIDLSVETAGKTVGEVTNEGNKKMAVVIEAMKKLGVEEKDIKTTSYNLWPRYNDTYKPYVQDGQNQVKTPEIVGYTLDQTVEVKIRDLTKVDKVIDGGIASGANQVGSLIFDIDETSNLKKQAREMAFGKAKDKALEMANAAGVKLGRVVTFSEDQGYMPYANVQYSMDARAESVSSAGSTIAAGSQELKISVSVTYEIE